MGIYIETIPMKTVLILDKFRSKVHPHQHSHFHPLGNYSTNETRTKSGTERIQTRTPRGLLTLYQEDYRAAHLPVPILGADVVGKGLGLDVRRVVVTVVVVVVVYRNH